MAVTIASNVKVLLDGYDISGNLSSVELPLSVDLVDCTVFTTQASPARRYKSGFDRARFTAHGFWDAPTPDSVFYSKLGLDGTVISVYPNGITEGSTSTGSGYAFKAVVATYNPGFRIGDLLSFDVTAEGGG